MKSRVGELVAPVAVSDEMMPGVVSLPHGCGHDATGARLGVAARVRRREREPAHRRGAHRRALGQRRAERHAGRGGAGVAPRAAAPARPAPISCARSSRAGRGSSVDARAGRPRPPSITRSCPVMKRAWSESRKTTASATSSAVPVRPSGVAAITGSSRPGARKSPSDSGVRIMPRRHRVHADARPVLERGALREREHARLRRGVGRLAAHGLGRARRRIVHDRAAGAREHQRNRRAQAVVDAE